MSSIFKHIIIAVSHILCFSAIAQDSSSVEPKLFFGTSEAGQYVNITSKGLSVKHTVYQVISWKVFIGEMEFNGKGNVLSKEVRQEIARQEEDAPIRIIVIARDNTNETIELTGTYYYTKSMRLPEVRYHL